MTAHGSAARRAIFRVLGIAALLWPAPAPARVLLTVDEALALAFADASVVKQTHYLTDAQLERARELAGGGVAIESALLVAYEARDDGALVGTAYFDAHIVRTLPETLMIVVAPDGTVARLEVLSFQEPLDYVPSDRWYAQCLGKPLGDELKLKRAIRPVTGATLTARATVAAVRRVLALHAVVSLASGDLSTEDGDLSSSEASGGGGAER